MIITSKILQKWAVFLQLITFYNDFTSTCNTFSEIEIPLSLRYYLTLDGSALNCLMAWLIAQTFRIMFDYVLTLISRQEQ